MHENDDFRPEGRHVFTLSQGLPLFMTALPASPGAPLVVGVKQSEMPREHIALNPPAAMNQLIAPELLTTERAELPVGRQIFRFFVVALGARRLVPRVLPVGAGKYGDAADRQPHNHEPAEEVLLASHERLPPNTAPSRADYRYWFKPWASISFTTSRTASSSSCLTTSVASGVCTMIRLSTPIVATR